MAVVISLAGSWIPSYWSDEVATLRASRLSWHELFAFVEHKDAVHAAYYSLVKLWVGAFGESELATRSLSAIAVAAAAAGLVVLVASVTSVRMAVSAGLIFTVLPRTTSMGIEARSFALSVAVAVWITVILLVAARARNWRWWAAYAALGAAGTYLFLYSVLIFAAHLVFLLLHHPVRRILVPWLIAASVAVATALPILLVSVTQKDQIAWLSDQPVVNAWTILVEPGFDSSWLVAAIAWCTLLLVAYRSRTIMLSPHSGLFRLAAAWFLVPLVLLLTADALIGPLYTARYLSLTVPAVAILLAIAFTMPARSIVAGILVAALALASVPTYIAQRGPFAKNGGSDLSQIADYIHSHAAEGDGIYLQDTGSITLRPRQALYAYPEAFADTADLALEAPFTTTGTFSDRTLSLDEIGPGLAGIDRIWVVTAGLLDSDVTREAYAALQPIGFFAGTSHKTNRSLITLYER
ncbi:glycosyltransferase family 39 protein [Cryobacterium sp. TMT4-31]|uniref:glycosyltransferase family 39 protein n=1 Tax=Cryobacterium sp. TMT4-31 TaxID=1259259 RepID=UPI00141BCBF7|nr:glycosyltransferase family 39 protein [Cryobacterium sp. TMT4-31]